MILMCDKMCQTAILDRDDGIRQQPPSQFQKQTNGLFCIKVLSENKKEDFWAPYLEKTAEAMGVIRTTVLVSDVRYLKEVALSSQTGEKREPYKYVETFDKAAIRHYIILHCEETVADPKNS